MQLANWDRIPPKRRSAGIGRLGAAMRGKICIELA